MALGFFVKSKQLRIVSRKEETHFFEQKIR